MSRWEGKYAGLRRAARMGAEDVLSRVGWQIPTEPAKCEVPIEDICGLLGIRIVNREDSPLYGEFKQSVSANAPIVEILANQEHNRKRFTFAHELGHWYLRNCLHDGVQVVDEERFCDEFASYLLLPDQILDNWIGESIVSGKGLTLDTFLRGAYRCGVSPFALVMALMQRPRHWDIDSRALVFVFAEGVGRTGLDFRIKAAAPPKGTFLPKNRRMTSLGLESLGTASRNMAHGEIGRYRGPIVLTPRTRDFAVHAGGWGDVQVSCFLEYIKLLYSSRYYVVTAGRIFES